MLGYSQSPTRALFWLQASRRRNTLICLFPHSFKQSAYLFLKRRAQHFTCGTGSGVLSNRGRTPKGASRDCSSKDKLSTAISIIKKQLTCFPVPESWTFEKLSVQWLSYYFKHGDAPSYHFIFRVDLYKQKNHTFFIVKQRMFLHRNIKWDEIEISSSKPCRGLWNPLLRKSNDVWGSISHPLKRHHKMVTIVRGRKRLGYAGRGRVERREAPIHLSQQAVLFRCFIWLLRAFFIHVLSAPSLLLLTLFLFLSLTLSILFSLSLSLSLSLSPLLSHSFPPFFVYLTPRRDAVICCRQCP